jgi:hypothetical protein
MNHAQPAAPLGRLVDCSSHEILVRSFKFFHWSIPGASELFLNDQGSAFSVQERFFSSLILNSEH